MRAFIERIRPVAHHSEDDLRSIMGVRDGQRTALRELYQRYTPFIYSVAFRILEDLRDADDAVRDTWVHVWTRPDTYDPRRASVAGWLLENVRARAMEMRRHPRPARDVDATDASSPPILCDSIARRSQHDRVTRAFAELSESQREVLTRAFFEGQTQGEIADAIDVPIDTVKSWTRQGLMRLVAILPGEHPR